MRATRLLAALSLLVVPTRAGRTAQEPSPFEPAAWGVVYDVPATAEVVKENLTYHRVAGRELTLDLYRLPELGAAPLPGVVFLNTVGDRLPDRVKDWGI